MTQPALHSFALGIATLDAQGEIIEAYFPRPCLHPAADDLSALARLCGYTGSNETRQLDSEMLQQLPTLALGGVDQQLLEALSKSTRPVIATFIERDTAPRTAAEIYLKLHLLSHRLCKPHAVNLQGAFAILRTIAWTSQGAITVEDLSARQLQARLNGEVLDVMSVDKFPKMSNYVVPSGVRIADTARVRLGAHIGEGTTVMHEGFVNFNAGTDGRAMIEGRISAGVMIGNGSDLGGGCSTMGTLSGGGSVLISVGRDCLIGANAGIGIALGDRCIVEAGLYITAGTKVNLLDQNNNCVQTIKARELSGRDDLLFRRNSQTGAVECRTNNSRAALNDPLHSHN